MELLLTSIKKKNGYQVKFWPSPVTTLKRWKAGEGPTTARTTGGKTRVSPALAEERGGGISTLCVGWGGKSACMSLLS